MWEYSGCSALKCRPNATGVSASHITRAVHLFREFSKSGSSVGALERLEEGVFVLEVESLDHGLSDEVALQKTFVLQSGNFGNVVITSFTLFFLEFNGDTTNWSSSNTFHQVSDEPGDLVSETLGWDNSDLLDDPLVSVEVQGQHHVVFLYDAAGSLLDGLGTNTTHGGRLFKPKSVRQSKSDSKMG